MSLSEKDAAALGLGKQARPAKRGGDRRSKAARQNQSSVRNFDFKPTTGRTYVVFVEGWHPTRVNQWAGRHWSVKHSLRRRDRGILWVASRDIVECTVPSAQGKRRVTLEIILGPRQRGGDPDAYWKCLLDNLVSLHLLRGDSKEWVELAPVVFTRGPTKATRITLEDLS